MEGPMIQVRKEEMKTKFDKRKFRQNGPLLVMFVPVILFFLIFKYVPMGGLVIAFKNYNFYDGIWNSPWVGLQNYEFLFGTKQTLQVIKNTFVLSLLSIFIGFPFPILIALFLNEVRSMLFKRTVQTIVYLPHFFSWVIMGGLVATFFSIESGTLNKWITAWTGEPFPFLYHEGSWIAIFVGSGIWKEMGFSAIIYLAAISTIDPHLYESAGIDGASKLKQMWHVTLPGILTVIVLMLILSMERVLEVGFDQIYVMQNAAVYNVSEVISTYMYRIGLQRAQFSLATAIGLFESLVGFTMVLIVNGIARKFNQGFW